MCWCSVLIILGSVTKSHRIDFKVKGRRTLEGTKWEQRGGQGGLRWVIVSPPDFVEIEEKTVSFDVLLLLIAPPGTMADFFYENLQKRTLTVACL